MRFTRFLLLFFLFFAVFASARTITDMYGHSVVITDNVQRVVTVGGTPAVNAFIFALGKTQTIQNGLPAFFVGKNWQFQRIFFPKIVSLPVVSSPGPGWKPNLETLASMKYDVCFVVDEQSAQLLRNRGIKSVVALLWNDQASIIRTMRLLATVFGEPQRATAYEAYYTNLLHTVAQKTKKTKKPKALYMRFTQLSLPMVSTASSVITSAGGVNVAEGMRDQSTINIEQLLHWNPDYLFVWNAHEVSAVYADKRLTRLSAVVQKHVYAVPMGAHVWMHYTPEQPLAVLWCASMFFPDRFTDMPIKKEASSFYSRFFGYKLDDKQLDMMLNFGGNK